MKKLFAVLLGLSVIFSISVCAFALQEDEEYTDDVKNIVTDSVISVNPVYEGLVSEDDLLDEIEGVSAYGYSGYVATAEEAGEILREQLKERKNPIVVYYISDFYDQQLFSDLLNAAYVHTGDPKEGDYIRYNNIGWHGSVEGSKSGVYYLTFSYTMTYCSDASQEKEVDKKVDSVIAGFKLSGKSDYEKVRAIYDYICKTVKYDYENLYDDEYILKFGTYAALINETAVCQGYATLFYRLALEAGVDARVISGIGNGGNHAWNIVELSDYYYNLDSTWDAGTKNYRYFLKCPNNFDDHYRDYEFETYEFNEAYPMAKSDYDPSQEESDIVDFGHCGGGPGGTNTMWSLDKNGVLTISGSGVTSDSAGIGNTRWYKYNDRITKIVVEEGVTGIGDYIFSGLDNVTEIVLPKSLVEIGNSAFRGCTGLKGDLVLPENVKTIGHFAFYECTGLSGNLVIPEGTTTIGNYAFHSCTGLKGSVSIPESITQIGGCAFYNCGINEYYFSGDAPAVGAYDDEMPTFDVNHDKIYYPRGNSTWEVFGGKWNGYSAIRYGEGTDAVVTVGSAKITAGSTAVISVSISENPGVSSAQFTLKYDSNLLEVVSCEAGSAFGGANINTNDKDLITFAWDAVESVNGACELLNIEFKAKSGLGNQETFVEADLTKEIVFADAGCNELAVEMTGGKITVIDILYGDADGNGVVNVLDANLVRRYSARFGTFSEAQLVRADVSGDGKVNIVDANMIRKYAAKLLDAFPIENK